MWVKHKITDIKRQYSIILCRARLQGVLQPEKIKLKCFWKWPPQLNS